MIQIGRYNKLTIQNITPQGLYLGDRDEKVLLPKKYITKAMTIGKTVHVFVYTDSLDRPVATTQHPIGVVGEIVNLRVVSLTKYGAFLDWGLEKDLFVPFKQMATSMVEGKRYVVRVCYDDVSGRVIGVSKIKPFLQKTPGPLRIGEKVTFIVVHSTSTAKSVIINNSYFGILPISIHTRELLKGCQNSGYVHTITPENKLEISLYPPYRSSKNHLQESILNKLKENNGYLPYNDKSSQQDINKIFGMSKKSFKKVIGNLYKLRRITINDDGVRII